MLKSEKINPVSRLKQIITDLTELLHDLDMEASAKIPTSVTNQKAMKEVREQLRYLRQFHTDTWIAKRIGVRPRQLTRWDARYCLPYPNHMRKLKELYDKEQEE